MSVLAGFESRALLGCSVLLNTHSHLNMINSYQTENSSNLEETVNNYQSNEEEEKAKRELLQQKHYFLFNELQTMSSELPL